jgi:ubiquinone/menaquinone biosynthesis C-methylase UbiE
MTNKIQKASDDTVNYFDSAAAGYDARYQENSPGGLAFRIRKQHVLELFDKAGGTVLDVGCGTGVIVDELLELGCHYTGVDPAAGMIDNAKKLHAGKDKAEFAVGSAEVIEYPDESFDAVICMGVIERVGDYEKALGEMVRVLKPGGTLMVTTPNVFSPYLFWRDRIFYPLARAVKALLLMLQGKPRPLTIPGHRSLSASRFEQDHKRLGAAVTDTVYNVYSPVLPPLEQMWPALAVRAMQLCEPLHKTPLRYLGAAFIMKSRKQ